MRNCYIVIFELQVNSLIIDILDIDFQKIQQREEREMSSSRPEVESLAEAVANGRVRTVKRRLESGENPNTHGADGCTPLLYVYLFSNL